MHRSPMPRVLLEAHYRFDGGTGETKSCARMYLDHLERRMSETAEQPGDRHAAKGEVGHTVEGGRHDRTGPHAMACQKPLEFTITVPQAAARLVRQGRIETNDEVFTAEAADEGQEFFIGGRLKRADEGRTGASTPRDNDTGIGRV